jgi:cell division septation protein DedD
MHEKTYISDLLVRHDCVIIPGLGGFVGSFYPASIDPRHHTFHPPYKKILFNTSLRQNDGLLADHIARTEGLPYSEANEQVRLFAETSMQALRDRRAVRIRGVGHLLMGAEDTIHFEQDMRVNLLAGSFGLHPFIALPVRAESEIPMPEDAGLHSPAVRTLARRAVITPLKWAAVLALPVGIALTLSFSGYDKIRSGSLSYADIVSSISERLSPFSTAVRTTPPRAETKVLPVAVAPAPKMEPTVSAPPVQSPEQIQPEPSAVDPQEANFIVIIGAFRIQENAVNLVAAMKEKGSSATLYDQTRGGLYRVASGLFSDREQALLALHEARANGFPGAWLLAK